MHGLRAGDEAGTEGRRVRVKERGELPAKQTGGGVAAEHDRHDRRCLGDRHRERLLLGVALVSKQRPQALREGAAGPPAGRCGRRGAALPRPGLPRLHNQGCPGELLLLHHKTSWTIIT